MAEIFVTVIAFSVIGLTFLSIVLALQLGLAQWGASRGAVYPISKKRHVDVPIIWTISCLMYLNLSNIIGAAIWNGPLWAYVWDGKVYCDIDSRLQLVASFGFICGVTAIARNLSLLIRSKGPPLYFQTSKKKWIDLAICATFPVIEVSLIYLIQPRRYAIAQDFGCAIVMDTTWPSFLINSIWTPIWSLVAAYYGVRGAYGCYRRKKDFSDILMCTGSGLTTLQFMRLMIFDFIVIGAMLPISLYIVIGRLLYVRIPGYDFDAIHEYFSEIMYVPYIPANYIDRWMYGTFAYVAFLIFGLGQDARSAYMRILDALRVGWIVRWIGASIKTIFSKYLIPKSFRERRAKRKEDKMKLRIPTYFTMRQKRDENDDSQNGSSDILGKDLDDSQDEYYKDLSTIQVTSLDDDMDLEAQNYLGGPHFGKSRNSGTSNSTEFIDDSQIVAYFNYGNDEAAVGHQKTGTVTPQEVRYHEGFPRRLPIVSPTSNLSMSNQAHTEDVVFYGRDARYPHHVLQHSNHPLYSPDSAMTKFDSDAQQHANAGKTLSADAGILSQRFQNLNSLGYNFSEELTSDDIFGTGSVAGGSAANSCVALNLKHPSDSSAIYVGRHNESSAIEDIEMSAVETQQERHRAQLNGFSDSEGGAVYYYGDALDSQDETNRETQKNEEKDNEEERKRESSTTVKLVPTNDK